MLRCVCLTVLLLSPGLGAQEPEPAELFELESRCLSAFHGRPVQVQAGVVLPPDHTLTKRYPICYNIHGFGGSHRVAWMRGRALRQQMEDGYPEMIYVFLNAQGKTGHHEFADSDNNGPWGEALITEFIPALEAKYSPYTTARERYLTGHSSGGWSSLWLQVTYPEFFNGTWSTSPDSMDFRDFTGINIYEYESAFVGPDGIDIPLMRRGEEWVRSIRQFVEGERKNKPVGGQFYSFNAVFSRRGPDGEPRQLFDWETGAIDRSVAESWKRYDIRLILAERWGELGPKLEGKVNVYMGTLDTFRLEGATRLLKAELERLGSDAVVLLVEGRNHGSIYMPHPEHWPKGMLVRIHEEMFDRFLSITREAAL